MTQAHAGLEITEVAFGTIAGHLTDALLAAGVSQENTDSVIAVVASLKS